MGVPATAASRLICKVAEPKAAKLVGGVPTKEKPAGNCIVPKLRAALPRFLIVKDLVREVPTGVLPKLRGKVVLSTISVAPSST